MFALPRLKGWVPGLLVLMSALFAPLAGAQANLLTNPGFESDAAGWQVWSNSANALSAPTIVTNAAQAHGGSKCAQLDWGTTETFMVLTQDINATALGITPGQPYVIKAWHKTSAIGTSDKVRINLTNVIAGGSAYLFNAGVTGTQSAWTEQSLTFILPDNQTTQSYQLQVSPTLAAAGTVYVDDVSLSEPPTGEIGNLLVNGGFESGATGWKTWSSAANALADATVVTDAAQAHGGSNLARLDWVDAESFMTLAQEIDTAAVGMTTGSEYVAHVWYKTSAISASNSVRINFTNVVAGGTAYMNSTGVLGTQSAWTEQVYSFTLPAGQTVNTYQLQINPSLTVAGQVYVDDVSLTVPGSGVSTGNLLDNPGFESGSTGWMTWSGLANAIGTPTVTTDAATAKEGSQYAQLPWAANESYLILYRNLDVVAKGMVKGDDYTVSAWYKTSAGFPIDQAVQLIFTNTQDGGSFWYNNDGVSGPVTTWTRQEATFTLPTDQTKNLYAFQVRPVAATVSTAGTLYVDDTALTVPPPPPTLAGNWATYE